VIEVGPRDELTKGPLAIWASRLGDAGDIWYITAATVVNVANFAFFGLVGHLLRPSAYGAVAALLNVVSIAAIPLNAVQAAIVREVVLQSRGGVPPTLRRAGALFVGSGLGATVLLAAASPLAARFFGLGTVVPVLLLALWLAPSVASSLFDGALIGTLRWRPIAVSLIAGAIVRVAVAAIAGAVDPGIDGPVLATVLNAMVTLGVVLWAFWDNDWPPTRRPLRLSVGATTSTVLALTGYSMLVAVDTLMARHIFPELSGNYAAAVTIGRIALFLPMAVTVVAFPRLVSDGGRGPRARRLLLLGLGGVLGLGLAGAAVLTVARHLFVVVLFGQRYAGASSLVGLLSMEGALLGAVGLLTYFHLARRSPFAAAPVVATLVVVVVSERARLGPHSLAQFMLSVSAALLAVMVAAALRGGSQRGRAAGTT
jgi:O-antigen/teichoic acid export membrane protein